MYKKVKGRKVNPDMMTEEERKEFIQVDDTILDVKIDYQKMRSP